MIIDPRAGHGAGIGGFKPDSQVGVALRDGHPVYFVVFRPHPEPGQTLADVMRAEAAFVARDRPPPSRRAEADHRRQLPGRLGDACCSPPPIPNITGPLVVNGAPVAYWSGRLGENPMRYNGGLLGGAAAGARCSPISATASSTAPIWSPNFEMLNPGRNYLRQVLRPVRRRRSTAATSFLEFENWWGGFHFMNEAEIRWIVEQAVRRQPAVARRGAASSTAALSTSRRSARRSSCSRAGATTSRRRSRR